MPSAALQACWTYLADVNLGSTAWPPNDQRCAYRHATLRRAQLACERTPYMHVPCDDVHVLQSVEL